MQFVVVLHNVRSAHNVGSVFRTSDAAGVLKIYLCGITPAPLDRFGRVREDFAKVALGAERSIPWEASKSTARTVKKLKEDGYEIMALEQAKGSIAYHKMRVGPQAKLALVVGNEVRGLPASVLKFADRVIEIPMLGKKESLNVSVAFGIAAFGLRVQSGTL